MKPLRREDGSPFTVGFSGKLVVEVFIALVERGVDFRNHFLGVEEAMPVELALYSLMPDNVLLNILINVGVHFLINQIKPGPRSLLYVFR